MAFFGSIRARLLGLALITSIPFAALVGVGLRIQWQDDHAGAMRRALVEARLLASRIDDHVSSLDALLLGLSRSVSYDPAKADANDVLLRSVRRELPSYISNVQLFALDGTNIGTSSDVPRGQLYAGDRAYFTAVLAGRRLGVGDPVRARSSGQWVINLARPVEDEAGRLRAVLAVGTFLDHVEDVTRARELPEGSVVRILNERGIVFGRSVDAARRIDVDVDEPHRLPRHPALDDSSELAVWPDGETRITGSAAARRIPWLVSVGLPNDVAYAEMAGHIGWGFLSSGIALVLGLAAAWILSGRIIRPLRQLGQDAAVLGGGDLQHRTSVATKDEVGALALTLNRMAESLERQQLEASRAHAETAMQMRERQALQETERRTKETLAAVIDASPVAIIGVAPSREVIIWNRAAESIFGYSTEEAVGSAYDELVVPPEKHAEFEEFFRSACSGESLRNMRAVRKRKDGGRIELLFGSAPLYAEDGRQRAVIFAIEDVTRRNAIEEQLRQALKMEAVGQLTGGLSHDLNNLLGIIIGNLDLLKDEIPQDCDTREMLEEALQAALRGADLNRRLLAFARRQPLQPRSVDLSGLVSSMTKLLTRTLGEHIDVVIATSAVVWPVVVDPAQLETALTNLALNARDAMSSGGRLTIATRNMSLDESLVSSYDDVAPGDYVVLEVSDSGTGMPPEVLTRVFEPFFTTKEVGKGTGLGLSMVFGFAKQSGGHIKIYSEVGHGTTVRLLLPRATAAVSDEPASGLAALVRGNGTVLVVEDNGALRRVLAKQLGDLGYQVVEAENAAAAVDFLKGPQDIDLLLTDIVMPGGMDGWELARAASEIRPSVKTIFTSGFPEEAFGPRGHVPAGARLLNKPYRRDELALAVSEVLAA